MLAIGLCWLVAVVGDRMGRWLEWLGIPRSSLPPFCRRPVGDDDVPAATPPPPGPTGPTGDNAPLLETGPLTLPPVVVQPPSLPPMVVPSEGGFYYRRVSWTVGLC
jgi:hypothetical protein